MMAVAVLLVAFRVMEFSTARPATGVRSDDR
jgi:hypothetical protein